MLILISSYFRRHLDSTPFASRSVIVLGALALVLSYVVYVLVVLCLESELVKHVSVVGVH